MNLWKVLRGKVRFNEPLCAHVTYKIGGPCRVFVEPRDIADLKVLLACAKEAKIPLLVLGAGSNILVADEGVKAAVCSLRAPAFSSCRTAAGVLEAGAGCMLARAIARAAACGYGGLEFLAGIPGTVGGAVAMNAGAWGKCIGDALISVTVIDRRGCMRELPAAHLGLGYRCATLRGAIIVSVKMKVRRCDKKVVVRRIAAYAKKRRASQEISLPSAGCVFKNPPDDSAGRLIDACGLKGVARGGARISLRHANFIVNESKALSRDIRWLMRLAARRVQEKFGIRLYAEVKLWN